MSAVVVSVGQLWKYPFLRDGQWHHWRVRHVNDRNRTVELYSKIMGVPVKSIVGLDSLLFWGVLIR
jgi:hypothetical protein